MRKTLQLFILFLIGFTSSLYGNSKDSLLIILDQTIKERHIYTEAKETELKEIKQLLSYTYSNEQKFHLYERLFQQYITFNMDSSLIFARKREETALKIKRQSYIDNSVMNQAEILFNLGMYREALDVLDNIDPKQLSKRLHPYRLHLYRGIYGFIANYTVIGHEREKYEKLTDLYRDSILDLQPNNFYVKSDQLIYRKKYEEAIQLLTPIFRSPSTSERDKGIIAYSLSEAHHYLGQYNEEKELLIFSAICDLKSSVREYVSLSKLALIMYNEGDIDRAYSYLKCSLEDATACNARLRTLEISKIFPILDNAYQTKTELYRKQMKISLLSVTILSFILLLTIVFIFKQMKKVAISRKETEMANKQLNHKNEELRRTNNALSNTSHIKIEYIAKYMDQCVAFLDQKEHYRRTLNKIAASGKIEELYKTLKSSKLIDSELKGFYSDFDVTFLKLFPNFVDDFNKLLQPSEQIAPRNDEQLTTELRIYALIRLGIHDNERISKFLRCSIATVYTYRSRVRNKALQPEQFEKDVMNMSSC